MAQPQLQYASHDLNYTHQPVPDVLQQGAAYSGSAGDELYEAKKDKEEDMPVDDAELDLDMEPEMDAPEDELSMAAAGATGDAKELINHLMTSLDTAKAMGNEKLTTQILNTLKFAIDQSMAQ